MCENIKLLPSVIPVFKLLEVMLDDMLHANIMLWLMHEVCNRRLP